MSTFIALLTPPHVMAAVAALLALAAGYVWTRPAITEPAIYGKRIAGTMLSAFAIILGGFAAAMASWGAGR
ncbi:MAG: hypothetical protein WC803_11905 [Sphingomonas sp.]